MPTPTDTPLAPSAAHLLRIRTRAHRLWQSEGRQKGQMAACLERARELDALEFDCPVLLPNPMADPTASSAYSVVVDEAALQENLGEFPTSYSDQGNKMATPESREIAREFRDGER